MLFHDEDDVFSKKPDAALVANRSGCHARLIARSIEAGLPVMTEKPLDYSREVSRDLIHLSQRNEVPTCVNLEFMFSENIEAFANMLSTRDLNQIRLRWHDPEFEIRHGEHKYGEFGTPIVHDSLPHCWSVLRTLFPTKHFDLTRTVVESNHSILLRGQMGETSTEISLSRRGASRVRKIAVNSGEVILDFSREPGTLTIGDTITSLRWLGKRPLQRSIEAFLDYASQPSRVPRHALQHFEDTIDLSVEAQDKLDKAYQTILKHMEDAGELSLDNPRAKTILSDWLPSRLERHNHPIWSDQNSINCFCEWAISTRAWENASSRLTQLVQNSFGNTCHL